MAKQVKMCVRFSPITKKGKVKEVRVFVPANAEDRDVVTKAVRAAYGKDYFWMSGTGYSYDTDYISLFQKLSKRSGGGFRIGDRVEVDMVSCRKLAEWKRIMK